LEDELNQITEHTLIILDESHHLRNDDGGTRLRNQRIRMGVRENGAKLLLLTATPFSKGIPDVNSQLALLPEPKLMQQTALQLSVNQENWEVSNSQV
jgi:superfamily II DNA or RNA helicase